jgi:hypothetical protein
MTGTLHDCIAEDSGFVVIQVIVGVFVRHQFPGGPPAFNEPTEEAGIAGHAT